MPDVDHTLTIKDPVDSQTLSNLDALDKTRMSLALQLADLEMEKLSVMGQVRRIQQEFDGQMAKILQDRGLSLDSGIQINPKDGTITFQEE